MRIAIVEQVSPRFMCSVCAQMCKTMKLFSESVGEKNRLMSPEESQSRDNCLAFSWLSDFSYIKQVDGQIRLRETKLAWKENWN